MKKNGFTLVELIGVMLILGILMLVVFPAIIGSIDKVNNNNNKATKEFIISAAKDYVESNLDDFPKTASNTYCICIKTKLIDNGLLNEDIFESDKIEYNITDFVVVNFKGRSYDYDVLNSCITTTNGVQSNTPETCS